MKNTPIGGDAYIDPIKNNNGITLIALVVTIIVLLILAGISLKLINGGDGIMVEAQWSEFVAEYTKLDEQKELYVAGKQMDKLSEEVSKVNWRSLFTNVSYALDVPDTIYPVDLEQSFSIFEAVDTLQATICYVENLQKAQLFDKSKVDLYRVDMSLLPNVEVRRSYVINIVSGMLYYIEGEPYKGLIYHTLKYGVSKDNPEFPTPPPDPATDLTIHYLSGYDGQEETQQIPSLSANSATLEPNTFARNDYTFQFWKEVKLQDGAPKYGEYTGTVYLDSQSGVDMKSQNMWLEADWTNEPMNTLTLDANGGYFEDSYLKQVLPVNYQLIGNEKFEIDKKEGDLYGSELAVEPERLSPVGSDFYYRFAGWFTNSNNGEKKNIGDTYTSAQLHQNTLYAHWEKVYHNKPVVPEHDLTIHYLSGCTQTTYTQTVPALSSTSVTLDLCKFNRDSESLTFLGWKIISSAANASAPYQYGGYFDVVNHLIKILDEDWEEEILDIIESYEDYEEKPADEESGEPVLTKAQARQAEILEFLEDEKGGVQSLFMANNMSLNGLADWMVTNQNYLKKLQAYEETLDDDDEDIVPDYYDGHKNVNMNGKDLWLEAVWTEHPLILDANGGTIEELPRITVELEPGEEYGMAIFDPDDREDHVFVGWFDERSGGKQFVDDDIYKSTELPGKILYAHWAPHTDPNVVPITFDANGGTMTDNAGNAVSILTKRKVIGYQMGSMPEPEQEDSNYIFDGWWTQPNGGTKVTSKTAVTGPMTVYAHWTIGNLVFLEKNGGAYYHKYKSAGNIENKFKKWNPVKYDGIQVANGQKIPKQAGGRQLPWTARGNRGIRNWRYVMKPNGGTKTVKAQWKGWYTQPNGAGTKIKWNSRYYDSYGDTLYANWRERSVIRYDANGGKWGKSTALKQKYPYVDKKLPKVAKPKKKGHQLEGWYDAPVGGNKVELKNASYMASQDMILYAHWVKVDFIVTFDATGGSVNKTNKTVTYGKNYGTLPEPTRAGYTFEGWYTALSGGTKITNSTIFNIRGDQTLYAHWKLNQYDITFNLQGGTGNFPTQKFVPETPFKLPSIAPTIAGGTFVGWSFNKSATTGYGAGSQITINDNKNVIIYAIWNMSRIYIVKDDVVQPGYTFYKHTNTSGRSNGLTSNSVSWNSALRGWYGTDQVCVPKGKYPKMLHVELSWTGKKKCIIGFNSAADGDGANNCAKVTTSQAGPAEHVVVETSGTNTKYPWHFVVGIDGGIKYFTSTIVLHNVWFEY